jgi:hypothetical protein
LKPLAFVVVVAAAAAARIDLLVLSDGSQRRRLGPLNWVVEIFCEIYWSFEERDHRVPKPDVVGISQSYKVPSLLVPSSDEENDGSIEIA